jgi:MFS family permease
MRIGPIWAINGPNPKSGQATVGAGTWKDPVTPPTRILLFVNLAHALVHYAILIYPTAAIGISVELGLSYEQLIPLATGGFVAFGLLSLPAGWLADRVRCSLLLTLYFAGIGIACLVVALASSATGFTITLLFLGSVAALYHPVGLSLLARHSERYGRDLGLHAVWGNLGAAVAAMITAFLVACFGWRSAFSMPGVLALVLAALHWRFVGHGHSATQVGPPAERVIEPVRRPRLALGAAFTSTLGGGMTYTILTIALPKIIDERYGANLPLQWTGALATGVFLCGALMQISVGCLVDRTPLSRLIIVLTTGELIGVAIAATSTGPLLLLGLALAMAAIFGEIVVDDALVGRFVSKSFQGRAYGASYCIGFGVSAVAVPLIGILHQDGRGFGLLLVVTAGCSGLLFVSAVAFRAALGR